MVDSAALCDAWRRLYPLAWTDFHRFVKGWSPGHWKIHGYSERLAREVLAQLDVGHGPECRPMSQGLSREDHQRLLDAAVDASLQAGRAIAAFPRDELRVKHKAAGEHRASQVVTEVDRLSETLIVERLGEVMAHYGLGLLTEEAVDDGSRFARDYFFCIDPLDGTLPYIEDRPGYAVSIGLVARSGTPVLGVVYDPRADILWNTQVQGGVARNNRPWHPPAPPSGETLVLVCDPGLSAREDFDALQATLLQALHGQGVRRIELSGQGGAVLNACELLQCSPALYCKLPKPQTGGGSLWDFAASAALLKAGGRVVESFAGAPLALNNRTTTFMHQHGVLMATDRGLALAARAALADFIR